VQNAWSHKFEDLIRTAGLSATLEDERRKESAVDLKWQVVEDWSENSRYEMRQQEEAEDLYTAVSDPSHGVLACIKRYW
jgi:hypothetical protein